MIEMQHTPLSSENGRLRPLVHLSAPHDRRWAGVYALLPFESVKLGPEARHDVYVITGEVSERTQQHAAGGFFSRSYAPTLTAGAAGAVAFVYRDEMVRTSGHESLGAEELVWFAALVAGMQVAPLSKAHHRLSLVSWQAGTRAAPHSHPHGEEILVLDGELGDERGSYPAGTWLRLHPGSSHAPYAEQATLTLLRSGHISTPCRP